MHDLIRDLKADLERYAPDASFATYMFVLFTYQAMWILLQYRISRAVHYHFHWPLLRPIAKVLCAFWRKLIELMTHCEFPNRAKIGGGLYLAHPFGVIIHVDCEIGENCNIGHHVTLGVSGRGDNVGAPKIGDRVFIGFGSGLIGKITIASDVAIGAQSLITKSLPHKAVAVGNPARIIAWDGSDGLLDPHGQSSGRKARAAYHVSRRNEEA